MTRPFILSPSLLSADCGNLTGALADLESAGISWVHWDVMDGSFVPNITFGQHVIKQLRRKTSLFFDVHLMIDAPERYLEDFKNAGAQMLCVHAESTVHLHRTVTAIRALGMKAGVALCPATSLASIEYLIDDVDMILLMSVNPGFGGQKFISSTFEKLRRLRAMVEEHGANVDIEVDGGVTVANTAELIEAGANILVSGSGFYGAADRASRFEEFKNAATGGTTRI